MRLIDGQTDERTDGLKLGLGHRKLGFSMEMGVKCPDVQESVAEDPIVTRAHWKLPYVRSGFCYLTLYHGLRRPFAHVTNSVPCSNDRSLPSMLLVPEI